MAGMSEAGNMVQPLQSHGSKLAVLALPCQLHVMLACVYVIGLAQCCQIPDNLRISQLRFLTRWWVGSVQLCELV